MKKRLPLILIFLGFSWLLLSYGCRSTDPESFFYAHKEELLAINKKIQEYPNLRWIQKGSPEYNKKGLSPREGKVYDDILQVCEEIGINHISIGRDIDEMERLSSIRYQTSGLGFAYFKGTQLTSIAYIPSQSILRSIQEDHYVKPLDEKDWYALIMLRDREQKVENGYELRREYFKHVRR